MYKVVDLIVTMQKKGVLILTRTIKQKWSIMICFVNSIIDYQYWCFLENLQ